MRYELLRIYHVSKTIENIPILNDLSLNIFRGELLGILGHNNEEKKALCDILTGKSAATNGELFFNDRPIKYMDTDDAKKLGIYYIGSGSGLFESLSIAENFYLFKSGRIIYAKKQAEEFAKKTFAALGIEINVTCKIASLGEFERGLIEIAIAYYCGAKLIILGDIMDEPLSAPKNKEILFRIFAKLKTDNVSIMLLTKSANDAVAFCDRLVLLKSGANIKTFLRDSFDYKEICTIMIGAFFDDNIKFNHICDQSAPANIRLHLPEIIDITAHRGEVIGIIDYGNDITYKLSYFLNRPQPKIFIDGNINGNHFSFNNLHDALKQNVGFIFGSDIESPIFERRDIRYNLAINLMTKIKNDYLFFQNQQKIDVLLHDYDLEDLCRSNILPLENKPLGILDQQAILMNRWLIFNPKIIICINPYFHFQAELLNLINNYLDKLALSGTTIIVFHTYLPILSPLFDRLLFIRNGNIAFEIDKPEVIDPFFLYDNFIDFK